MANSPSQTPTPTPTADESDADRLDHWCYHCSKRVSVETVENLSDVICHECKNGFVEVIRPVPSDADRHDDSSFISQFEYVLRMLRQVAREDNGTQPAPQDPQSEDDFFGVQLDGWYNDEYDDDENDNVENEPVNDDEDEEDRSIDENEENRNTGDDDEGNLRRITREVLRRRARNHRRFIQNRWTGIRMGFGDNSIEVRFDLSDSDRYVGNPEDYVDAAGFEELLQNLAESDIGRRGAPPAAKSAVSGLPTVEILSEAEAVVCSICKDVVGVGEFIKKLPCGHGYHGDCIEPWLSSRNSCPICRFELPTDDAEYEEERNKRAPPSVGGASASGVGNSGSS